MIDNKVNIVLYFVVKARMLALLLIQTCEANMEYQVYQKVFVYRGGSHRPFTSGEVVRVLKSFLDVQVGNSLLRFNRATGREAGSNNSYFSHSLDRAPYAEREAQLAKEERLEKAARAINLVTVKADCNPRWGKEYLVAEVARLTALLTEAAALVEAI